MEFYYVKITERIKAHNNYYEQVSFLNYVNLKSEPLRLANSRFVRECICYSPSELEIIRSLHIKDAIQIINKNDIKYDKSYRHYNKNSSDFDSERF